MLRCPNHTEPKLLGTVAWLGHPMILRTVCKWCRARVEFEIRPTEGQGD